MAITRDDASGHLVDSRFHHLKAGQTVTPFKPVSKGGETTAATVLGAVPAATGTWGSGQVSVAFPSVSEAGSYIAEAWLNTTPNDKKVKTGTESPLVVTGLSAGASTVRVRAVASTVRDDAFVQGAWSPSATGSVT